jgi:hypothetical protein
VSCSEKESCFYLFIYFILFLFSSHAAMSPPTLPIVGIDYHHVPCIYIYIYIYIYICVCIESNFSLLTLCMCVFSTLAVDLQLTVIYIYIKCFEGFIDIYEEYYKV